MKTANTKPLAPLLFFLRQFTFIVCFLFIFPWQSKACAPLNVPSAPTISVSATTLSLIITNTSTWLNCPNVIDVEFACNSSNFSGLAADTYTTGAQSFGSSPYTYSPQAIPISDLCPGIVYKFRIRERNSGSTTSSNWSSTYTFMTLGTAVQPQITITASPNLICPPAPVTLSAQIIPGCGRSGIIYAWFPTTGLSNPSIANPVANITSPITYTCIASGGATGCWGVIGTIFINVGTGPPIPGTVAVTPTNLCVYNSATLSTTAYTGNIQWQASTSSTGPWNNIPGATTATFAVASVSASTCFRSILTSCNGSTISSNVTCAVTNSVPTLTPSQGCTNTISTLSFSYMGTSGTPTAVVWSPPPLSVNANSTTASYNNSGSYYALAFFGDGCISSTSFALVVPSVAVNASTVSCAALGSATVQASNMFGTVNYFWLPTPQTNSVATNLFPGTYTCLVAYNNNSCSVTQVLNMVSTVPLSGTISASPSILCPNAPTGTASILIAGGSGNTTYTWTNANLTLNTPTVSGLTSGVHTVTVEDQITFCTLTLTFQINSVPALSLSVVASSPTVCVGSNGTLTAQMGGGTPGYSYTWTSGPTNASNVITETNSGPYTYTVTSSDANNCSITQTASLTFISLPTINVINTSICPGKTGTLTANGASSYTWNNSASFTGSTFTANPVVNTNYNVAGTFQGCVGTSIGQIQMLQVPVPVISSNNPICNGNPLTFTATGGIGFLWSGPLSYGSSNQSNVLFNSTSTQSGVYSVTVTAANTCTASTNSNFTVYASPPVSVVGSTVCSTGIVNLTANSTPGATYLWSGPSFTSSAQNPSFGNLSANKSGNYTVKVTSAVGCTNVSVANVTITQLPTAQILSDGPECTGGSVSFTSTGGVSYVWTGPNGFNSNVQNPTINQIAYAGGGIYQVQATTGPCVAFASHSLVVFPLPTVIASNGGNVCETKTLQLNCQTGGPVVSYSWSGPLFTSSLQNPFRQPASLQHNGTYTVTVGDANGCQQFATTTPTVLQNPNVSAVGATVCLNQSAVISADGASTYQWFGPNLFQSVIATPTIPLMNQIKVGTYTVIGKAVNTCTSTVTVNIATLKLPVPSLTVSPSNTICLNGTVSMSGGGGKFYKWYGPEDIYIEGKDVNFTFTNFNFQGTYTLVAIDEKGCAEGISTLMRVYPLPDGAISGSLTGCAPYCSNFKFLPLENSNKMSATWSIESSNYPQKFYRCFDQPGTYSITGYFYDSLTTCKSSKSFSLIVHPSPTSKFEISPINPIENLDEALLTSHSEGDYLSDYTWYFANKTGFGEAAISHGAVISKIFDDAGYYVVAMVTKNKFGCEDTVVKRVEVAADFFVFVPNVFTPNGDRMNEKFVAVTRGVKLFEMSIYNRWGTRVFYTKDPKEGWDGHISDSEGKSDTYTWRISATSIHGEHRELTGHVTLYR